jgi:integrase
MAHIRKDGKVWRVQVEKKGVRKSGTFATKAEATEWAAQEEAAILDASRGRYPKKTLADALHRYVDDISSGKAGYRFEKLRLESLERDYPKLAGKLLTEVNTADMAEWRDSRLKTVSSATVQREINLISNVFTKARDEWLWCGETAFKGMQRPRRTAPRKRRVTDEEVSRICAALRYEGKVETKLHEVALAFLVSLETAMRAGEILSLNASRVNLETRVATVPHKMKHVTLEDRDIPLTREAAELLKKVSGRKQWFTISSASLDTLFRKARDQALVEGLHFHDARAEALTRLSRRVDVMTLAKISGHTDLRILQSTYYRETAEQIAARL